MKKQDKTAIFARVSTEAQDNDRQVKELTALADAKGWHVVETITETASGAASRANRAGLRRLLELASAGSIRRVVISEVSRLGRNVADGVNVLNELSAAGVTVYIANIGIETLLPDGRENFMFKPILLTLLGFAEMEREQIRERVKSGLEAAKKRGQKLGRPAGSAKEAADLLSQYRGLASDLKSGLSIRKAAKVHDVSPTTVQKVKAALLAA
jgi:DNA invertase Pin-like site-specific DNA recombinase